MMEKIKIRILSVWRWISRQFKHHAMRSLAILIPAAALVTVGILLLRGVSVSEKWSYLPNREYILAPTEQAEPQTLYEMLHSDDLSIDTFLRNPGIAQELLGVETLTDIVDSRFALYNLREIDRQLEERLSEDVASVNAAEFISPENGLLAGTAFAPPAAAAVGEAPATQLSALDSVKNQNALLAELKHVTERLTAPVLYSDDELVPVESAVLLNVTWNSLNEAGIHLFPEGKWLPQEGYSLTRVIGGQETEISVTDALNDDLAPEDSELADMLKELYLQAELTREKLDLIREGMTPEEFNELAYRVSPAETVILDDGTVDFENMRRLKITVPNGITQKMPQNDAILSLPALVMEAPANGMYDSENIQNAVWNKFSVNPSQQVSGLDAFGEPGSVAYETAAAILLAREYISTLSTVESKFADAAGFLITDDLSGLGLAYGTEVTYVAKMADAESAVTVTYGKESVLPAPDGLKGYGIDGLVPLRWNEPASDADKAVIGGYLIERRLDGEKEFARLTSEPTVIGYELDETSLCFQSPIFYQDEVENGRTAEYRVCAIDIYGGVSGYSDTITIKVEKVTPPDRPATGTPVKFEVEKDNASDLAAGSAEERAVQEAIQRNAGTTGIALPIYAYSPDTARFTIYRAMAIGAGGYGAPEPIANVAYDNAEKSGILIEMRETEEEGYKPPAYGTANWSAVAANNAKQILLTNWADAPDLVYFDAEVQEGCTYKYWVSAWDEERWNNESAWSMSATVAIPSDKEPEAPTALHISLLARALPDRSQDAPGLVNDEPISMTEWQLVQKTGASRRIPTPSGDDAGHSAVDADTMSVADSLGLALGSPSAHKQPKVISDIFDNFPEQKYIHTVVAVQGGKVLGDGTARIKWPEYSGEGLEGYNVYQAMFEPKPLAETERMSRTELMALGYWQKLNVSAEPDRPDKPITQNQFVIGGLTNDPGKLYMFLICLQPEAESEVVYESPPEEWSFLAAAEYSIPSSGGAIALPVFTGFALPADEAAALKEYTDSVPAKLSTVKIMENNSKTLREAVNLNHRYKIYTLDCPTGGNAGKFASMSFNALMALGGAEVGWTGFADDVLATFPNDKNYEAGMPPSVTPANYGSPKSQPKDGYTRIFMLCYVNREDVADIAAGFVNVEWEVTDDPQIKYYRIYRTEVPSFKEPFDETAAEWTLVGDRLTLPKFTDPVDQTHAYYYYYRLASVSPWGVESSKGAIQQFRVPATKPPATPNLLVPLQKKDGVQVNFSAVQYCDRYEIYRLAIPRVSDSYLSSLNAELKTALFALPGAKDDYLGTAIADSISRPGGSGGPLSALTRFNTSVYSGESALLGLGGMSADKKLAAYQKIYKDLGPLALSDYRDLSVAMMKKLAWEKIGELPSDSDTAETVHEQTGLRKPLSYTDKTAEYGIMYLYTVQAWNDDNLGSTRPEPIEASPRRSGPFDRMEGLKAEMVEVNLSTAYAVKEKRPVLTWNTPTMKNLDKQRCLDETVGYIVYRSDKEDGEYYQASPMVFETTWTDKEADPYASNWYKVRVLDTGGYLSDFSLPVLAQIPFLSDLKPVIPDPTSLTTLSVSIPGGPYTVGAGGPLVIPFAVTGDEPITYSVEVSSRAGARVVGAVIDAGAKTVTIPGTLQAGAYGLTLTAENGTGSAKASANFTVEAAAPTAVPPKLSLSGSAFTVKQGEGLTVGFAVTGTEPISFAVSAVAPDGAPIAGIMVNASAKTVQIPNTIQYARFVVTLTASNSAGSDSASFIVTVEWEEPPYLESRSDNYAFNTSRSVIVGSVYEVQLSATGSEPLTWSLEPYSPRVPVPDAVSVSQTGLLTVKRSIAEGTHRFQVVVTNNVGSDTREVVLTVTRGIEIVPRGTSYSGGTIATPAHAQPLTAAQTPNSSPAELYGELYVRAGGNTFMLKNVVLSRETPGSDALYGTATLDIGPSGIPVDIARATIKSGIDGYTITEGALYITKAFEIPELGITIASMNITPQANRAVVSGYVKSTTGGQNIVGSLHAIEFMDAELHPGYIGISGISDFRYEQFTFKGVNTCHIALGAGGTDSEYFIQMDAEEIYMKSHLETLNNESFQLERSYLAFDRQGKMTAEFFTKPGTEQFLQLLVPGGAGLRVGKATVRYDRGIALASGTLQGRLILPFENAALSAADPDFGAAGVYTGHPDSNEMDELAAASGVSGGDYALNDCLNKFGQKVQQNALLIVPQDHALQELCSYADVHVENWSGKGFTMAEATLTPTSVTNRNLDLATQREQATVVAPTRVSVDLDRDAYIPPESVWGERAPNEYMNKETMLPMETQKSFWVGLVVHGGTVGLPPAFIQGNNNETITFDLAPGEMIYDLNGFSYQTYLYNNEGVAANFGSALGGFEDVMVYNCLLDMYANRVSLEINAKVRLELFNNEWVNAKLYTNETDNENGRAGEFLCSVAPTLIEAASGAGIDMRIGGGFFKPDGMHFHGEMTLSTDEVRSAEPLAFTDMIVPPKREMTNREFWSLADKDTKDKYNNQKALGLDSDSWMKYGKVTLSKPANVTFQGFTMEVRTLHLEYSQSKTPEQIKRGGGVFAVPLSGHATYLTLSGATVLADNIPLGQENTDVIKLDCRKKTINPKVLYEQCVTVLSANFDDATDLKGALRPNLTPAGESAQQGASGVSAPNSGQGFEVMPLSAGGIPTLPPMPEIPDISKFKGAAEEQVKAYQKALEEEVAQYKKQVEDQVKGLAKEQAEALKKQAQEAMDQYVGDAVNELKGEYEKYKKELSETLEKYKKELMKELEKYIDVGMLGQGLIEFNADTLSFGLLDSLKNAGVDMTVRFGYDIANSRCYYVVGANSVKEDLDLGVMKVSQFAALFHRNVELPTDITKVENLNKIRTSEEMKKYVEDIKVHREADSTFGIAVIGTIKMGDTVMLKDACLYIASGPIISAGGELWAKTTFDEYNLIAAASLCYDHPRRYLSVSVTLKDIPCGIFTVSGSIGLEVGTRPALFGLYLGYPETLKAGKVLGIFEVGAGLGFKISESEMCAMWKMEAGAGLSLDFGIVYASGYLRYGTYGEIKWVSDGPNYFEYTLWAEGQIKGGIWFFGKRDIINIYGRAQGSFIYDGNYRMDAELTLRYKVSLFVASISGSHNWHIGTKF